MNEHTARTIDACCKIVATAAVVVGGIVGLSNYLSSRNHELYIRQAEAAKPALEERLKLCVDLTSASGTIATSTDPKEKAAATMEFERIYWGPFGLIESGNLSDTAAQMETCLEDSSRCPTNMSLQQLSRRLALMCRSSLGPNWGFPEFPKPGNVKFHVK